MKFSIANSINVNKLDGYIENFQIGKGHNPYMFVNVDTANELVRECVVAKLDGLTTAREGYGLGAYRGCKVFMDDTKTFGEVELR